jgi:uncharacterized protein
MTEAPFRWGWGRIIGYSAIILVVYFGAQVAAIIAAAAVQAILEPEFDLQTWSSNVETDGFALSLATFAAAVLCVPLMRVLVGLHERAPWQLLGLRRVAARDIATACAAAAVFIAFADPINIWVFERPLVPPFMRAAYASSRSPVILFLAIVVVAPLFEELVFRGFLFGVLRGRAAARVHRPCIARGPGGSGRPTTLSR